MAANRAFVLALGLVVGWTSAHAQSRHETSRHHAKKKNGHTKRAVRPAHPVEDAHLVIADDAVVIDDTSPAIADAPVDRDPPRTTADTNKVALDVGDDPRPEPIEAAPPNVEPEPAKVEKTAPAPASSGWQLELGPYLWASDVNASVSFAGVSTGTSLSFVSFVQHARYGMEAEGELRRGRFAIATDFMYGAAEFTSDQSIGPLMATLTGNAASLLVDGIAGYDVLGDESSLLSLEARGGVRYQRTSVSGGAEVIGFMIGTPEMTDAGSDEILGARAVVRPLSWLRVSGMADIGVAGASDKTWSATGEASVRISSGVRVTLGWRTLTMVRSRVNIEMTGPRASVQIMF